MVNATRVLYLTELLKIEDEKFSQQKSEIYDIQMEVEKALQTSLSRSQLEMRITEMRKDFSLKCMYSYIVLVLCRFDRLM